MLVAVFVWTLVEGDYVESAMLLLRWAYVYRRQFKAMLNARSLEAVSER